MKLTVAQRARAEIFVSILTHFKANSDSPCGRADDVSLGWKRRKSLGRHQEKCRDASSPRRYPALLWEASLWAPQSLPRLVALIDMAFKQHLQYTTQNLSQFTDRRIATTLVQIIVLCRRESGCLCCQMLHGRALGTPVSFSGVPGLKFGLCNSLFSFSFSEIVCTASFLL
jgi:hypothetical protein